MQLLPLLYKEGELPSLEICYHSSKEQQCNSVSEENEDHVPILYLEAFRIKPSVLFCTTVNLIVQPQLRTYDLELDSALDGGSCGPGELSTFTQQVITMK